jgi:uncharacterized protein DUF6762
MESTTIILMEKEKETGFLNKEVDSYTIEKGELISSLYLIMEEKPVVYVKITVDKEVEDWEYSAIYDCYNEEVLSELITSFEEVEDCYNPPWEVTIEYDENRDTMEEKLNQLVEEHFEEINRVYQEIEGKKEEYME